MTATYYACQTLWLQTGQPASTDLKRRAAGDHLKDTFLSVERGDKIPADALSLLDGQDIANMLAKGQISTTRPEVIAIDDWQDIPAPAYPEDAALA
ncbi:MAG: hypothetical protein KUA43_13835 [Hoeflea sp.]|uniref:hypothetical protein n=1 Tax=Hoeflea sp. TaxID=1940281 RepID=UPI001DB9EE22|nr:hypothetical protein [Hoeflea sp.]MBU4531239.1 hypothetical protein [Alphaproteobacteria bacterium]MBU4545698.1 hypothetical protein [Alphaproteobacteria bacterium]MBU4550667.1 hypothetical protein [Alphaproteobacteria bacterium]MBV1724516.1 hypothetical protein [Hoeflea sp.]MBV1760536.1 hypothetical protein [Hoeflea sp.]